MPNLLLMYPAWHSVLREDSQLWDSWRASSLHPRGSLQELDHPESQVVVERTGPGSLSVVKSNRLIGGFPVTVNYLRLHTLGYIIGIYVL